MRLLSTSTTLCYCVFWKKLLLLACFVVSKYVSIYMNTGNPMADKGSSKKKYLQDYRRPFTTCKLNEE